MAEETIIERAVALWRQGLTPLPCGNPAIGGGKAPCVQGEWKPWQTKTCAVSADGETIKAFTMSIWDAPPPEPVRP